MAVFGLNIGDRRFQVSFSVTQRPLRRPGRRGKEAPERYRPIRPVDCYPALSRSVGGWASIMK